LLAAYIAFVEANSIALAVEFADTLGRATMRANGAFRPETRFNVCVRGLFIVKV
jgi:hypothetical protein